jgi:hypothetical protein
MGSHLKVPRQPTSSSQCKKRVSDFDIPRTYTSPLLPELVAKDDLGISNCP